MAELFRNPQLNAVERTLAWCLQSSSLIDPSKLSLATAIDPAINHGTTVERQIRQWLSEQPSRRYLLEDWLLSCRSKRIGHQFEYYWHFYWKLLASEGDNYEWLFNQQVNSNGITLGELDALKFDYSNGALHHYELAIKFYLGYADDSGATLWLGPNCRDRLDLKLQQMCDKQLTLLDRHPQIIPSRWPVTSLHKHLLVKGWLFYPLDINLPPPDYVDGQHHQGIWLRLSQAEHFSDQAVWVILQKSEWLGWFMAPASQLQQEQRLLKGEQLRKQLKERVNCNDQPAMLVLCRPSSQDPEVMEETRRYVVVADDWPQKLP